MHVTYLESVAVSRDVANYRFSRFVKLGLSEARARGMTDRDIEEATGVTNSTFHRWQRGEFGRTGPSAESVRKFCDGLGLSRKTAMDLLAWSGEEDRAPTPEPELPPEVKELLRRMRDPNVDLREKEFIRETLRSLVARKVAQRPVKA